MSPRIDRIMLALAIAIAAMVGGYAQETPEPQAAAATSPAVVPQPPAKQDALLLYRQGRDLEAAGRNGEAQAKFGEAVRICDQELSVDARRIEAYVVKAWSLFRLGKHLEVISTGQAALKLQFDARAAEVMGESYYHLGQMDNSLKYLQRYVDAAGDGGDRVPTAYFYMGEAYLRLKRFSHADIAYSAAVTKEPNLPRWWFRLGGAVESLGEWKRAYDAYSKAIALSPAYQEAVAARDRVKTKLQ